MFNATTNQVISLKSSINFSSSSLKFGFNNQESLWFHSQTSVLKKGLFVVILFILDRKQGLFFSENGLASKHLLKVGSFDIVLH